MVSPPPVTRDPACPFVSKYLLHVHTTYQSGILGSMGGTGASWWHPGGNRVNQAKICIRGHNCCQTGGIELSKCVYLTSMGVKIERTVGVQSKDFFSKCISDGHVYRNIGHNQSKNCENLCFSPSKLNDIHGKLSKIKFCYKFCCI